MESEAKLAELIGRMRLLEADHTHEGWPTVQMRDITDLCDAIVVSRTRVKELEALHRTYYNQPFAEACQRATEAERERCIQFFFGMVHSHEDSPRLRQAIREALA